MSAQPRMSAAQIRKTIGRPSEDSVHVPLFVWMRENLLIRPRMIWHTPAETNRSPRERQKQQARGFQAGIADITFVLIKGARFGCIEVKRPGSTESDVEFEQRAFGRSVVESGGLWTWVDSVEAGKAWCRAQGIVRPRGWVAPWVVERQEHAL